jgi:predicted dehydrogenase
MKKIKVGIIGMGRMGITHFSIVNSHPQVEIIGVADTSRITLDILKKYVEGLEVFNDYKELIEIVRPDAIIVCTPPKLHYDICKIAFDNNVHVFVEKPFTADVNQSQILMELFSTKCLIHQVGYVNRFNDVFATVKDYVNKGLIGDVIRFKSEMFSCTVSRKEQSESWRSIKENGGGVVYEMASHAIDLVDYIIGKPDKIVGSVMNKLYSKNVEDIMSSTFLYNNGCTGTIYVNWCDTSYRKPSNKLELFGTKGKILADQHSLKIFLNEDDSLSAHKKGWNSVYITDIFKPVPFYVRGNEFTSQLYYFLDSILGSENGDMCTFRDGSTVQIIMDELFKDAERNLI